MIPFGGFNEKNDCVMRQVTRKGPEKNETKPKPKKNGKKCHPAYGTSKLEVDFAANFLDKLGVEYKYQFEAKDIGRFYDYYLPNSNLIIEVDGDYWHGNKEKYSDEELNRSQKKARRVDELKNKWALMHGIPILRLWESEIRKEPQKVMHILEEVIGRANIKNRIVENRTKKHIHKKIDIEDED